MTACKERILHRLAEFYVHNTRAEARTKDAKADEISAEVLNVLNEERLRPMVRAYLRNDAIALKVLFGAYVDRAVLNDAKARTKASLNDVVDSEEREHEERMAARQF